MATNSEDEEFEFRARAEQEAGQAAGRRTPKQMRKEPTLLGGLREAGAAAIGPFETGLQLGTGAIAGPIAGYAGLLGAAIPGEEGQGADWARRVQSALTYEPRTDVGKLGSEIVSAPFVGLGKVADIAGGRVSDIAGPAAGTAVNVGIQSLPALAGYGIGRAGAAGREAALAKADQQATVNAAAKARIALSQIGIDWGSLPGQVRARITQLAKDATKFESTDKVALGRIAKGQALPVPVELTRGQALREPSALRAEENLAQTEAGKAIRERQVEQNRALTENLDILKGRLGGKAKSPEAVGQAVAGAGGRTQAEGALTMAARKSMAVVDSLYDKARAAGEMDKTIDIRPLTEYLRTHDNPGQVSFIMQKLKQLKLVREDEFGNPHPTHNITLNQLEGIRRAASKIAGTSSDGVQRYYAGQAVRQIDRMIPDSAGGVLYKAARSARRSYAMRFEEPKAVSQLLAERSKTDRAVALEDVWDRTVMKGSLADLQRVKNELLGSKDRQTLAMGRKAWKDLASHTIEYIKNEATKGVAADASGNVHINPVALKRSIDRVGDTKLEMVLGKSGLQQLKNIANVTYDVKTLPPFKGGSTTIPNFLSTLENILGKAERVPFVGPIAGGAVRMAGRAAREGTAAAQAKEALRSALPSITRRQPQKVSPTTLIPLSSLAAQRGEQ